MLSRIFLDRIVLTEGVLESAYVAQLDIPQSTDNSVRGGLHGLTKVTSVHLGGHSNLSIRPMGKHATALSQKTRWDPGA